MKKVSKKAEVTPITPEDTEETPNKREVVLPDGTRRIDFIRDNYYGTGELAGNRGGIKDAINEQLEAAGRGKEEIPYQIVFSATKSKDTDPRIAQEEAATQRAEEKKAKDEIKAQEKADAKAKKEAEAAARAEAAAKAAEKK